MSEKIRNGTTKFIRKLNIGYSKYFNLRYKRSGTLFQGRTKKVLVSKDAHFLHILNYIHLNPLDYKNGFRGWREKKIPNVREALDYLESYKWSSYADYCNTPNFTGVTSTRFFKETFVDYPKALKTYLESMDTNGSVSIKLE